MDLYKQKSLYNTYYIGMYYYHLKDYKQAFNSLKDVVDSQADYYRSNILYTLPIEQYSKVLDDH